MLSVNQDSDSPAGVRRSKPELECDVVMKGGITSGVVYPGALGAIGATYRFRGVGGTSAGAIGAALGSAAEFGRESGGFERLDGIPASLYEGKLGTLFQPQPTTRQLLPLMLAMVTGRSTQGPRTHPRTRVFAVILAALKAFPLVSLLGVLPGLVEIIWGFRVQGGTAVVLVVSGVIMLLAVLPVALLIRLVMALVTDVPDNLFGICRGLGSDPGHPGITDWLADRIDEVAQLPQEARPLRFGQLWTGGQDISDATAAAHKDQQKRLVDLRMITTCLNQGRPYELPWDARGFFFDLESWTSLFPRYVIDALIAAPPASPPPGETGSQQKWEWLDRLAGNHEPCLFRLPDPEHLPVIVATRLSLSFPLLISAVPLWTINFDHESTVQAFREFRSARRAGSALPGGGVEFSRLWFTDGGLCSNFPMHMFDAALTTRPTFAINLGRFPQGQNPDSDESKNIEYATTNQSLPLAQVDIPNRGLKALAGFAAAAFDTARDWRDNSYLTFPGHRDRVVRVMQTKEEGGLNLHMDNESIDHLAQRGQAAGRAMVEQFTLPRYPSYPSDGQPRTASGWDNHRWVRYRALLTSLPAWLMAYERGRDVLDINAQDPPSYKFHNDTDNPELAVRVEELAAGLDQAMRGAAAIVAAADPIVLAQLTESPRPQGSIKRDPPM